MAIPAPLTKKIEAFLAEKSLSTGGYAPVSEKDISDLAGILDGVIQAKYEKDPDGDLPISFNLIDRTRYISTQFFAIPHTRDGEHEDIKHFRRVMSAACGNLSIAQNQVDQAQRMLEFGLGKDMDNGHRILVGDRVYERRTAFTDNSKLNEAAHVALNDFVKKNPLSAEDDYEAKKAWEEKGVRILERKLGTPTVLRRYPSRDPGKMVVSLELIGLSDDDAQRRVSFTIDAPEAKPPTKRPKI